MVQDCGHVELNEEIANRYLSEVGKNTKASSFPLVKVLNIKP